MKVLFFAPSAYLLGGVQDWMAQLVPYLRDSGMDVVVAVPDNIHHQYKRYSDAYPNLNAISFHNNTGSCWGRIKAIYNLLNNHDPDLVVAVNIGDLFSAVRLLRRDKETKFRFIVTVHALEPSYIDDIKHNVDLIDAVVTTNRLTSSLVKNDTGIEASRVYYAPYGVALHNENKKSKQPSEKVLIAWVGRIDKQQKNISEIPKILKELDLLHFPYKITIAGDGPDRDFLLDALNPWLESGKAVYLGRLSKDKLIQHIFSTHHALLITSIWETGPIVAWEAMAYGVAVVSSMFVGSGIESALIHEKTALLYETGNVSQAAHQIARLRESCLYESLIVNAFQLIHSRYSSTVSNTLWKDTFLNIALKPSLPPPLHSVYSNRLRPSGKLDYLLGIQNAERIRSLLNISYRHTSPGNEWPHTLSYQADKNAFLAKAAYIDQTHVRYS